MQSSPWSYIRVKPVRSIKTLDTVVPKDFVIL